MTRSEKLQPVVKHVDKNEKSALEAVAFSQQQLQKQRNQLQQLNDYINEYTRQHSVAQSGSFSSIQLQEYNRFFTQLNDTITRQTQVVAMAQREVDMKRQKWKLTRSRSDAMHKIVNKIEASELKQADKIEQKLMDEVALRISSKYNQ
ncbi:MAG: flagellar export protein FliJ [Gammaproteobacteria bacterium]|nr:flagellar export protein FliJ [Gammaproteobacteria bacterium]